MSKALNSRYKKSRDLIDYDYLTVLGPEELAFLEAFTASFYNGSPSDIAGSVPRAESFQLNGERRRDLFAVGTRVETGGSVDQVVEVAPYRSAFAEGRKKYRRAMKVRKRRCA